MTDTTTTPPLTITDAAITAALIPSDATPAFAAAITKLVRDLLDACNTGNTGGLPIGVVAGGLTLVDYSVKDTLRVLVEAGLKNDGTVIDATDDALAIMEAAAANELKSLQDARAARKAAMNVDPLAPAPAPAPEPGPLPEPVVIDPPIQR